MKTEVFIILILIVAFACMGKYEISILIMSLYVLCTNSSYVVCDDVLSIDDASRLTDGQIETFDGPNDTTKKDSVSTSGGNSPTKTPERLGAYMGAIDFDEHDLVDDLPGAQRDRRTTDSDNPFDLGRYQEYTPEPCDELATRADNLDGSERTTLLVRSQARDRRQQAGIHDRLKQVKYAFEEELIEEEDSHWWGRHET